MNYILSIAQNIGREFLAFVQYLGSIAYFAFEAFKNMFVPPYYFRTILKQIWFIGYLSLPVVGLTAIFTGAVLALQSYNGFARFNAESSIATVVVLSITRELGPVLAGLMVAGRIGASIAAEIGTMKVTEQLSALHVLSTDPFKYLVTPRVIAGIISMPLLVTVADIIGVLGGYLISVYTLNFSSSIYIQNTLEFLQPFDYFIGLIKAAVFGFLITLFGSYYGYNSGGGAVGVGKATTTAVVMSSISILLCNYFITSLTSQI